MLRISAEGYTSARTIAFQRGSVIVTEAALVFAALWHCRRGEGTEGLDARRGDAAMRSAKPLHADCGAAGRGTATRRGLRCGCCSATRAF